MIRFEHSLVLWLLLLIPIAGVAWSIALMIAKQQARRFVPHPLLDRVAYGQSPQRKWWRMGLWLSAATLLIIALAGPQIGTKMEEVKREGVDVLVAVDLSNSMLCEDFSPSRLESAKLSIQRFVNGLKGDRVGLIAFAGTAIYHCPLTTDYGAVKLLARVLNTETVPEPGTALSEAITMAKQAFSEQKDAKSKVLVIITDGEDHEPAAIEAAEEAKADGISIYTIGLGTPSGAPIPFFDPAGRRTGYRKDREGQVIVTRLNETHLEELANAGGGRYVRATQGGRELEQIWDDLSQMEKQEFGQMRFTSFEHRFAYFVFPAMLLLLVEMLLGERSGQFAGFMLRRKEQR